MDLREYVRVLFKRLWVVALIALVGAGGAYGFSKLQQPIYDSTIMLKAVPANPTDYGQSLAIKTLLQLYSQEIQTKIMAQQIIDQLQLDKSPDELLSDINVSANEATLQLEIQVKYPEQDTAPKIAQQLAQDYVVQHQQDNLQIDQMHRILISIMDNATPPELFSPKTKINVAAGGILGGLAGVFVIFLLEFLQSAYVRSTQDVERYLGLTMLGTIPTMTNREALTERRLHMRRRFWQRA